MCVSGSAFSSLPRNSGQPARLSSSSPASLHDLSYEGLPAGCWIALYSSAAKSSIARKGCLMLMAVTGRVSTQAMRPRLRS